MQNFMKTIISAVQTWTKGKIKDSTADWNQNDSSADSYVKNRTHWEEEKTKKIVSTTDVTFEYREDDTSWAYICDGDTIAIGHKYIVIWDGVEYNCIGVDTDGTPYIGNSDIWWYDNGYENNGVPFCIYEYGGELWCGIYNPSVNETHTVSISTIKTVVHTLDPKYLDLPTNLATTDDVQEAKDEAIEVANTAQATANTAQATADAKMDKTNPVGTGSFSMNRKSGTTVGNYSHAEGYNTTASGKYSHAEGYNTTASGNYSHAEGYNTTASGNYSHAEGYNTIAKCKSQHTQGEYNILDLSGTPTTRGTYAHIVGNGTSDTARSNAHTLDWNGVGWFKGGLQVGGNAQGNGASNVILAGVPQDYLVLKDTNTGLPYKIEIRNGNLISSFAASLDDFTYTTNEDGTRIIACWNETYLGVSSTEMVVPNDGTVIL